MIGCFAALATTIELLNSQSPPCKPVKQGRWHYDVDGKKNEIEFFPQFCVNEGHSALNMCAAGLGIGRFTETTAKQFADERKIQPILTNVDWGKNHFYAVYPQQQTLPLRTRTLIDFIAAHLKN